MKGKAKVLRVVSIENISDLLISSLEIEGIICKLMAVYHNIEENVIVLFESNK
jgi:hypothetical protein